MNAKIEQGLLTGDSEIDDASSKELDHLKELDKLKNSNDILHIKVKMIESIDDDSLAMQAYIDKKATELAVQNLMNDIANIFE